MQNKNISALWLLVMLVGAVKSEDASLKEVLGVYATGSEISGYTSTKLNLYVDESEKDRIRIDKFFVTDVVSNNEIPADNLIGKAIYRDGRLIIAEPFGFMLNKQPRIHTVISEYFPVKVNNHIVLMRSDSHTSWTKNGTVYDYGILVKVAETTGHMNIKEFPVEPFKMSDVFGIERWKDPFVNGPNKPKD